MDLIKAMPSANVENYIFKNNHDLTFSNMQKEWGFEQTKISSGAVYADLDNDGDLDLIVNNINQPSFIFKNKSREQFNTSYVSIKLTGKKGNVSAIGSKVYVYANGTTQYQEVNPNRGYLSCVSTVLNFGLGTAKNIDSIRIIWNDNTTQLLTNVETNQKLVVDYKEKLPVDPLSTTLSKTIFTKANSIISYKHEAFDENDFKRQLLMLFMYSKTGPVMAKADVNKDGLEDLFISGDKNQAGKIYLQKKDGPFASIEGLNIGNENTSAVSAATFFDANGDGFDDLYVAKGGYSLFEPNTLSLQDELYLNDGKARLNDAVGQGNFILSNDALPDVSASSKSCVRACDYDNDGDMDLFVGGRIVPGQYPSPPKSYLLTNDGKGKFIVTETPFSNIGMVTDAQWFDVNNDGRKDLILCGEFMPIIIFINTTNGFVDKTSEYFDKPDFGFWFTLTVADVDGDGKQDIIAGNVSPNTQLHFSDKEPAEMYYADFDGNGSIDPFFNCYIEGTSYPFVSRDELNEQIYSMRKKFTSYKSYADATMKDIFNSDELSKAAKLMVNECHTVCYLNKGGKFVKNILPMQAQFSVVTKIIADDFNHDGKIDLLLLGNHSDNRLKLGSIDANYGCLLTGDGKGNFNYVIQPASGLSITGDVKSTEEIIINNKKYVVVGISNEALQFFYLVQ